MNRFDQFIERLESVGAINSYKNNGQIYEIAEVDSPGHAPGSRVLIDVKTQTGKKVLIGGDPLEVKTLHGVGTVHMVNLKTGQRIHRFLEPSMEDVRIPTNNILYWYENLSDKPGDPLTLRGARLDFDPKNEPSLEDVCRALGGLFIPQPSVLSRSQDY